MLSEIAQVKRQTMQVSSIAANPRISVTASRLQRALAAFEEIIRAHEEGEEDIWSDPTLSSIASALGLENPAQDLE